MQAQIIKTTVEIDSGLFYLAKMKALQDGKSLKYIINQSLSQLLNQSQTVDLLASIQKIVEESGVTEDELQKSGRNIRKQ